MRLRPVSERVIILLLSLKLVLAGLILSAELPSGARSQPASTPPPVKTQAARPVKAKPKAAPKKTTPAKPGEVRLPSTGGQAEPAGPALLRLLHKRREDIRQAEARLTRQRQELVKLKAELDSRLARLNKLQADIKNLLDQAKKKRAARIGHLTSVLSNMQPEAAARLFEALDLDLVVAVVSTMQGRQAGRIMALVKPKRAAQISSRMAEIRRRQQSPPPEPRHPLPGPGASPPPSGQ
jgi:flagellar motility protein MotE (MotC chaperone)